MIQLSPADVLVMASCLGALAGVIFAAGRLTARVDELESWRRQMSNELGAIHTAIRHIEAIVRGEST